MKILNSILIQVYFNPTAIRVFSPGPNRQQVITGADNMCYTFCKGIVIYSAVPL